MGVPGFRRMRALAGLAVVASIVAVGPARSEAATLRPTSDVAERFLADPLADPRWEASGSWSWEPSGTYLATAGAGHGTLVWTAAAHYTGTLRARLRLGAGPSGQPPRARLVFALDPATLAHRWVEVEAGDPGRVVLGQSGAVRGSAEGIVRLHRTPVPAGTWQELVVTVGGDKGVTVSLGGTTLFRAGVAPLAPGLVGFGALGGEVAFDEFSFTTDPDGEPCRECHGAETEHPLAPDVYAYWDGRWWDGMAGSSPSAQTGGHGDPGGRPALGCTGASGCHDLRQPGPGDHRNGVLEGRGNPTTNSFHLRVDAMADSPASPWDAQVAVDRFCYVTCHAGAGVGNMRHELDGVPAPGAAQLGTHMSYPAGASLILPYDGDLTTRGTAGGADFAPCVSCHDPHGTGVVARTAGSNRMVRLPARAALCSACHP